MALPLDQSIQRFISNDERMNTFANGSDTATYTTNTGVVVPSINKFISDKSAEIDAELNLSSPLPIGNVTPNTGKFTTLTTTGNVTLGDASTDTLNVGNGGLIKDAAGNVGIGVTPSAWFAAYKVLQLSTNASLSANTDFAAFGNNYYTNASGNETYLVNGFAGQFRHVRSSGQFQWSTAPSGTAGAPISFTQAMTLDAGGNLLVGTTTLGGWSSGGIALWPSAGSSAILIGHKAGTASATAFSNFGYNGVSIGTITQSGTTAVAYNTTSDHRLKENVRDADAARFMDIKFRDFEWIDGRHDSGVIAHELQEVYPDLVLGEKDATEVRTVEITPAIPAVFDEDGSEVTPAVSAVTEEQPFPVYQQVNYTGLIGRMGTRVQALQRTVDAQAALIAAMEARLSALEAAGGSK